MKKRCRGCVVLDSRNWMDNGQFAAEIRRKQRTNGSEGNRWKLISQNTVRSHSVLAVLESPSVYTALDPFRYFAVLSGRNQICVNLGTMLDWKILLGSLTH